MRTSRNLSRFLIIILLLTTSGVLLVAADYGESSDSLGQFTDEYEDLDHVSVNIDVVRNSTLNVMELNYSTSISTEIYNLTQLKEHDYFGTAGFVDVNFIINNNDEIRAISTSASQGWGYMWITVDRDWLDDKYIRFRYYPYASVVNVAYQTHNFQCRDGEYDRSSAIDFPVVDWPGSLEPPLKGNGVLYDYTNVDGLNNWYEKDFLIDTSGGSEDNVTLWWRFNDGWDSKIIGLYLDWIEINTGAGGPGNLITINFNNSSPVTMEVSGGENDYGFALNPELPFVSGGFVNEGYFTTTDYLDEANGSILVLMTNTTIPEDTGITVEFSEDNATWTLNDWDPLFGGFESIDLRELNWSNSFYVRYNETTSDPEITPRLYQSRLITTEGPPAGEVEVEVITYIYGGTAGIFWLILIIIVPIVAYMVKRG